MAAYTTVQPGYGDQYNNEAIAGCVMGGTSMAGGLASISGTVNRVFIIALLQEGILALGFTKDYQLHHHRCDRNRRCIQRCCCKTQKELIISTWHLRLRRERQG